MAEIKEFKGLLYNIVRSGEPSTLFCPPYDVISPEEQKAFYNLNPYNIIRIELGYELPEDSETENRYTRAKSFLKNWETNGILYEDRPSIYLYLQSFIFKNRTYQRPGIIAAVKIEDFENKVILPHEKTLSKPKQDRFNLLKTTLTNVSQIFGFFSDSTRAVRLAIYETLKEQPLFEFTDSDGTIHSLYHIHETYWPSIKGVLHNERIYIADGHHRYETALRFRNILREKQGYDAEASSEYVMMTLTPIESDLVVFPVHRLLKLDCPGKDSELLKDLSKYFIIHPECGPSTLESRLFSSSEKGLLGVVTYSGEYLIQLKNEYFQNLSRGSSPEVKTLDVNILNHFIFEKIFNLVFESLERKLVFSHDAQEIRSRVKNDPLKIGFLLRSISVETIKDIAFSLETLPQKSTYFFPKVWTGLVMRKL